MVHRALRVLECPGSYISGCALLPSTLSDEPGRGGEPLCVYRIKFKLVLSNMCVPPQSTDILMVCTAGTDEWALIWSDEHCATRVHLNPPLDEEASSAAEKVSTAHLCTQIFLM